ncbi:MAG: hypothetical protein LBN43_04235 [Oscillospiraceae bacterium]|nr:hypothetical protein [Oscillospiraceae bacterium]
MTIIKEAGYETLTWREHEFTWEDDSTAGYAFEVDESGEILNGTKNPAYENFQLCVSGQMTSQNGAKLIDNGIVIRESRVRNNAVGVCRCGEHVELHDQYMGACECPKCGQWYNLIGDELVPPEYWEEDNGDYADLY